MRGFFISVALVYRLTQLMGSASAGGEVWVCVFTRACVCFSECRLSCVLFCYGSVRCQEVSCCLLCFEPGACPVALPSALAPLFLLSFFCIALWQLQMRPMKNYLNVFSCLIWCHGYMRLSYTFECLTTFSLLSLKLSYTNDVCLGPPIVTYGLWV